jgi:hypothetical protein
LEKSTALQAQVTTWATPTCNTATYSNGKFGPNLIEQTANWPTPQASDEKRDRGSVEQKIRWSQRSNASSELAIHAALWPTPAARDGKGTNSEEHTKEGRGHMCQLANFVAYSPLAQATRDGGTSLMSSPNSPRHLNPLFAAWLMGWPSTWAIAEPHASSAQETVSFRSVLRSHLSFLLTAQDCSKSKKAA